MIMKSIGFVISYKENEKRRALIPEDLKLISCPSQLLVETGYGDVLGYSDEDYLSNGAQVVSRSEAMNADIVCDPKIGDADYLSELKENQIIFGWVHAVQNRDITDSILQRKLTAIAWEDMFEKGRHVFYSNNEIAGEAAIMHAFQSYGLFPRDAKVAVLGRGNVAQGAIRALSMLGADVSCYSRKTEKLFNEELGKYDVIVNAILWDTKRKDHIVYKSDLLRMKRGAMIVDISCDRNGAIETSVPTTISEPIYYVDGICHYVVDHTPALFFKSVSRTLSSAIVKYLNALINDEYDEVINDAIIIREGIIIDKRINDFQHRI